MSDFEYVTQTQIGQRRNLTSHQVGRFLKKIGWRNPDGSPTQKAIEGGLCRTHEDRGCVFWVWHAAKTLAAMEESIQDPAAFAAAQRERAKARKAVVDENIADEPD